jgi:hypothetical protein
MMMMGVLPVSKDQIQFVLFGSETLESAAVKGRPIGVVNSIARLVTVGSKHAVNLFRLRRYDLMVHVNTVNILT